MPARSPFTTLCQLAARGPRHGRADLHLHTQHSDGDYTPAQVLELARRAGLAAIAITDHDTLDGIAPTRALAAGGPVEVISGVELTTRYADREIHVLAYFFDPLDSALAAALREVQQDRVVRFRAMVERLRHCGVSIEDEALERLPAAPGRRHLADWLVQSGQVATRREAFARYLHDGGQAVVAKRGLGIERALTLVRSAGGVAALAHPTYDWTRETLAQLRSLGLGAVEVDFPSVKKSQGQRLRQWAAELGLAVTGGSDCHGPGPHTVGSCTISNEELAALRRKAAGG